MWKRIELHNHTMESDGSMTVKELAAFMEAQGIPWFSLTDHNTVSGFPDLPPARLRLRAHILLRAPALPERNLLYSLG